MPEAAVVHNEIRLNWHEADSKRGGRYRNENILTTDDTDDTDGKEPKKFVTSSLETRCLRSHGRRRGNEMEVRKTADYAEYTEKLIASALPRISRVRGSIPISSTGRYTQNRGFDFARAISELGVNRRL